MEEIIRIDEHSWRIEDSGVRYFLLEGDKEALLVDSGMHSPDARKIAESLTDRPVRLINTHADPDHISGNGSFDSFMMNPAEEENYRVHHGKGQLIPVSNGYVIDLGNRIIKIIVIPGHTPGSIALLDETDRVLISGDSVQDGNIFMFGKYRDLSLLPDSLRKLNEYRGQFDVIYPSHGSFPVYPELIDKVIEGAETILAGSAEGTPVERFGMKITLYRFPYAGFLCEPK